MDPDMLVDLYGFLPAKYFVSRLILGKRKTNISFVDYERQYYDWVSWWLKKSSWHHNQEYGPTLIEKTWGTVAYIWRENCRCHRNSGQAIIFKNPVILAKDIIDRLCEDVLDVVTQQYIDDKRLAKGIWVKYGMIRKIEWV